MCVLTTHTTFDKHNLEDSTTVKKLMFLRYICLIVDNIGKQEQFQ